MRSSYRSVWKEYWEVQSFRIELPLTLISVVAVLAGLTNFLQMIEQRPGIALPDPLLALFTPLDVTWLTFGIIYAGLCLGLVLLARQPPLLLRALQSYVAMVLVRMVAMYLVPLEAPDSMIPLVDPTVEYFGTGTTLTKDLYFSGHTSTLFLLFLTLPGRWHKVLFLSCTVAVAVCVIAQHVHYAIDVFSAPFFAYTAYRVVVVVRGRVGGAVARG